MRLREGKGCGRGDSGWGAGVVAERERGRNVGKDANGGSSGTAEAGTESAGLRPPIHPGTGPEELAVSAFQLRSAF